MLSSTPCFGIALVAAAVASAAAEGCPVPHVGNGGKVQYLNVQGIKCDEASRLVAETIKAGYGTFPKGYVCKTSVSGRNTTYTCDGASGKKYEFRYGVY